MPTRISLRRVEEPPRASSWPYPVRWPNFSRMRRRLENAPLLVGLKPRSKCSNQSFGRGASSYLCAVPRPTDQPLTTLSASKHDRPTDQRAVVGDFGWQLSKTPRRCPGTRRRVLTSACGKKSFTMKNATSSSDARPWRRDSHLSALSRRLTPSHRKCVRTYPNRIHPPPL